MVLTDLWLSQDRARERPAKCSTQGPARRLLCSRSTSPCSEASPDSCSGAGVGAAGLLDLRATVYRAEEHARLVRAGELDPSDASGRRKAGIDVSALRNRGVDERNQRDRAQLQVRAVPLLLKLTA